MFCRICLRSVAIWFNKHQASPSVFDSSAATHSILSAPLLLLSLNAPLFIFQLFWASHYQHVFDSDHFHSKTCKGHAAELYFLSHKIRIFLLCLLCARCPLMASQSVSSESFWGLVSLCPPAEPWAAPAAGLLWDRLLT